MERFEINGRTFTGNRIVPPTKANRLARTMAAMLGTSLSASLATGGGSLEGGEIAALLANLDDPKLDEWLLELCRHGVMLDAAGNPVPIEPDKFNWNDPYEMIVIAAIVAKVNGFFSVRGTLESLGKVVGMSLLSPPSDSSETSA